MPSIRCPTTNADARKIEGPSIGRMNPVDPPYVGESIPSLRRGGRRISGGIIRDDHDLEKIVVGNEPAVSGGLGSQVTTHSDNDTM